eukprot:6092273-Alexandrium_andersonii.AAC.1
MGACSLLAAIRASPIGDALQARQVGDQRHQGVFSLELPIVKGPRCAALAALVRGAVHLSSTNGVGERR